VAINGDGVSEASDAEESASYIQTLGIEWKSAAED